MLNVVIPMGVRSSFFDGPEYPYPTPLIEVAGLPMIELVISNLKTLHKDVKFIFILRKEDCQKYHLDKTLKLLAGSNCQTVVLEKETMGAACSSLLAIDHISSEDPLVIVNSDQTFDYDLNQFVMKFDKDNVDAASLYFQSVLPRWSYLKLDSNGKVLEAAEKNPISKNAIAGFYYFKKGQFFIDGAIKSILNSTGHEGRYYISPVLNELILENKVVKAYPIENSKYHSFYTPQKIAEYESKLK